MKVLHINASDIQGGAARAANRLHKALLDQGVYSRMLVQAKASDDRTVIGPGSKIGKGLSRVRPTLDQLPNKLYSRKKATLYHTAWVPFSGVVSKIQEIAPDIVHLHWIAGGYVRIEQLGEIKQPIVWSLHDMWAFTGGCHYDGGCEKYQARCGSCPMLGSTKDQDVSRWVFRRKKKHYAKIPYLVINGLSSWLAECAESSKLFQDRKVVNLPNPIDTEVYRPMPKVQAKKILGLSPGKRQVLFGALNATADERKGFTELVQALGHVISDDIELAVFGSSQPENAPNLPFQTRYLGRLHDDISLRILYSAADVMVVPSKQENLSNAIMEALACGTPVVAFDIGGNKDMIVNGANGYLAQPFDPADLARGITNIVNTDCYEKYISNARSKAIENFAYNIVATKYVQLYERLIKNASE